MRKQRIIYIAGVKQHAGKTVTSLGIISSLMKKIDPSRIGYIKPVGQEFKSTEDGVSVDKDAIIIEKFAHLRDMDLKMVSPVRIGSGVTKSYLTDGDQAGITSGYVDDVLRAVDSMASKDVIIAEGTGHPGVGSLVGMSNAKVSNILNARIVYLAGGGLGSTIDEMDVMMTYFHASRCNIKGVIFNKVIIDKLQQMRALLPEETLSNLFRYLEKPLSIYGFLPVIADLDKPSMQVIYEEYFKSSVITSIVNNPAWHVPIAGLKIISLANDHFSPEKYGVHKRQVAVIGAGSVNRIKKIIDYNMSLPYDDRIAGIILTCADEPRMTDQFKLYEGTGIPVIYAMDDTATTDEKLFKCIKNTKLQVYDDRKHDEIVDMFDRYFDVDKFIHDMEIEV